MSYYCELPEFYSEKARTAIKQHKCCECNKPIAIGERYVECGGKWDGEFSSWKQHSRCYHFARWVNHDLGYIEDECIPFGGIHESLEGDNHLKELWQMVYEGAEFSLPMGRSSSRIQDAFYGGK